MRSKWATDDDLNHFKIPFINSDRQTLKIQGKKMGRNLKKKQGVPLGFSQFFGQIFLFRYFNFKRLDLIEGR